jgi:GDPmannose 4,6-dehydratase
MPKVAFITGITGQDGSYLAELLLEKGYIVYGMIRRSSTNNTKQIDHIFYHERLNLRYGDITDIVSITNIVNEINDSIPDIHVVEVYNLAAQSHVQVSFQMPLYTCQVDAMGVLNILEVIRNCKRKHLYKFYQASTSELFGEVLETPQTEKTPFNPRSPYGAAKSYGFSIVKNYRESYDMFACSGLLYNHESPRRGINFVTRKITRGLNQILTGEIESLHLGNISSLRDWGHAKDYVYGMWLMLQQDIPKDYILASGTQHSVKSFVEKVFAMRGFNIAWSGNGINEIGYDIETNRTLIVIDPKYFRPCEVQTLLGDSSLAREMLGWEPKISFDELVQDMVDNDCPV